MCQLGPNNKSIGIIEKAWEDGDEKISLGLSALDQRRYYLVH